jgi:hypothetical protein
VRILGILHDENQNINLTPLNFKTPQLQNSSTSKLLNFKTPQLQNSSTSKLLNFKTPQLQNSSTFKVYLIII